MKKANNFDDFVVNYTVLRFFEAEDYRYKVIYSEDVVSGYLHDTYDRYGQPLDSYAASDWTLSNSGCDFAKDLTNALKEKFPSLDDEFHVDPDRDFDEDLLNGVSKEVIDREIEKYVEEESTYTEAVYFNYWDGSNRQSVIIDCPTLDYEECEIVDDEEVLKGIFNALDKVELSDRGTGIKSGRANGYCVQISAWQNNPWLYELEEE